VAITLVELGLTLDGVLTALDVDRGLRLLASRTSGSALLLREVEGDDGAGG
jgi:rsbT antagonist protein RsbS